MNFQKWEYKILTREFEANYEIMQDRLNKLGNEGWELVAANPFTLKRPLNISINTENLNNNVNKIKEIIALCQ